MEPDKNLKDITILIVDDFGQMRTMLKRSLEREGFAKVMEAEDGDRAISWLQSHTIDFIISDWDMPRLDGLGFLKYLRSNSATASIPFLMITGKPNKRIVLEAVNAGVDGFMVKPFSMAVFLEKVTEILRRRRTTSP